MGVGVVKKSRVPMALLIVTLGNLDKGLACVPDEGSAWVNTDNRDALPAAEVRVEPVPPKVALAAFKETPELSLVREIMVCAACGPNSVATCASSKPMALAKSARLFSLGACVVVMICVWSLRGTVFNALAASMLAASELMVGVVSSTAFTSEAAGSRCPSKARDARDNFCASLDGLLALELWVSVALLSWALLAAGLLSSWLL